MSYVLLKPLEFKYDAYEADIQQGDTRYIVVMSGYALVDPIYPLSSRVNGATLFRLSEAFLVWRERPTSKLILAGPTDMTSVMEDLLMGMGVPKSAVLRASKSRDTIENIRSLGSILSDKRFILVTSAGHMQRAVLLAKRFSLEPIPAPTDYYTSSNPFASNWLPTPFHLELSDLAAREYMALAYYHFFPGDII